MGNGTRKGANNDHVFRNRAPLFIARVDPETLRIIRSTLRVLVPERGARLGNFAVTEVGERETWITVAEWMQTWGPNIVIPRDNKYGADNSDYVARILWDQPNAGWSGKGKGRSAFQTANGEITKSDGPILHRATVKIAH